MTLRPRARSRDRCASAGRVTAHLLLSFLAFTPTTATPSSNSRSNEQAVLPLEPSLFNPSPEPPAPAEHTFTLRHIFHHGTDRYPRLHRRQDMTSKSQDIWLAAEDDYERLQLPPLKARSNAVRIERLVDRRPSVVDPMVALGRERGYVSVLSPDSWTLDDVPGPNISDKSTVLSLAYMSSNAYVETPDQADWDEVGDPFNRTADFGWEGDGLRGHVFADETNSTVVIGLKGTSMAVFDGEGTTTNDKVNDNLFFSCCCAQQGPWLWHQVCDCATGTYTCNNTCVVRALRDENRYYMAARELYSNVTELFPDSNIWLTGHSLGGAVSSLLGLTYGVPVVTFEAVPEALPAGRLGLPVPPGSDPETPQAREYTGTYHVGHTADPVYIGTCNGATASCSYAGYAMQSACHTGQECVYDVVADKGWRVGIGTHKIRSVIHDVILAYDTVPECHFTPECRDCAAWKFYESNGTETTTTSRSSTSTKTRTRTETCKTPGWWGCLDETTTTTGTATTTTTTSTTTTTTTSTSTCETPGWFGCKDKTTTTSQPPISTPASTPVSTSVSTSASTSVTATTCSSSTTCITPGRFWGCYDDTATATTGSSSTTCITPGRFWGCYDNTATATTCSSSTTCITPGRFWGCYDDTTTAQPSSPITAPPVTTTRPVTPSPTTTRTPAEPTASRCVHRYWFGLCKHWGLAPGDEIDEI